MFDSLVASKPRKSAGGRFATAVSVVVHAAIAGALLYMPAHVASAMIADDAVLIALPQDAPVPVAPPALDVPPPVQPAAAILPGFTALAVPDVVPTEIPAPQVGVQINAADFEPIGVRGGSHDSTAVRGSTNDLAAGPFMTPMEVAPKLLNRDEVSASVSRNYPSMLRDAGISGTTKVWFYIDQNGHSIKQLVKTSSGYAALDSAALRVAPVMRFSPAIAHDRTLPVWVAIDIVFRVN